MLKNLKDDESQYLTIIWKSKKTEKYSELIKKGIRIKKEKYLEIINLILDNLLKI
jgi:hypothetical protein